MSASTHPPGPPPASPRAPWPAPDEPPIGGLDRVDLLLAAAFTVGSLAMMLALF